MYTPSYLGWFFCTRCHIWVDFVVLRTIIFGLILLYYAPSYLGLSAWRRQWPLSLSRTGWDPPQLRQPWAKNNQVNAFKIKMESKCFQNQNWNWTQSRFEFLPVRQSLKTLLCVDVNSREPASKPRVRMVPKERKTRTAISISLIKVSSSDKCFVMKGYLILTIQLPSLACRSVSTYPTFWPGNNS